MIDFHAHILPQVDDGPSRMEDSLTMLSWSFQQGVDIVVSTSHFYGNEEYPDAFIKRRNQAYEALQNAMLVTAEVYPNIVLGAEVLFFPGISEAEDIIDLRIGTSRCILIEPPMSPWSDRMLDEIAQMGKNLHCLPVIAHVDRYMQILRDKTLIERVRERKMLVQVNVDYFLNSKTIKSAMQNLKLGNIHLIGSDCHNLESRVPNLWLARRQAKVYGAETEFNRLHQNAMQLLLSGGE